MLVLIIITLILLSGLLRSSNQDALSGNESCTNNGGGLVDNLAETSSKTLGPNIRIPSPGDPSAYFAPISPAAKTSDIEQIADTSPNPIMEMLRGGTSGDVRESRGKMSRH